MKISRAVLRGQGRRKPPELPGGICKNPQHLIWVQNSVFEGELTKVRNGLAKIVNEGKDSVIIYIMRDVKWMQRDTMGVEKSPTTNIL